MAAPVRGVHGERRPRVRRPRHRALVDGRARLGRKAYCAASAAAACSSSPAHALSTCRDWLDDDVPGRAAHGLLAPWVLHTGLGPDNAASGFMTQVIACALQLGGMPVPLGGGMKLVDGLAEIVRDAGGELRTEADVERIVVSEGRGDRRRARRRRDGRCDARRPRLRHADAALRPPARRGDVPGRRPRRRRAVPLRPRRDADPHRAERAAALEGATERLARTRDRPPHARARRRLARRQRGRPRPAAGRGDDRRRPADAPSIRRARPTARGSSGSSSRSSPPGRCAAMRQARSTFATEPGPTTCGRHTPTGSSRGSATRSRTSAPRRSRARSSHPPTSRR